MSIREDLANGIFEQLAPTINAVNQVVEWYVPESNPFEVKTRTRLDRMEKSESARTRRHMLRDIKQKRHQLEYTNYSS